MYTGKFFVFSAWVLNTCISKIFCISFTLIPNCRIVNNNISNVLGGRGDAFIKQASIDDIDKFIVSSDQLFMCTTIFVSKLAMSDVAQRQNTWLTSRLT